jgi:hypothetical protein
MHTPAECAIPADGENHVICTSNLQQLRETWAVRPTVRTGSHVPPAGTVPVSGCAVKGETVLMLN